MSCDHLIIRQLFSQPYGLVENAMHQFTARRSAATVDELWLVQHPPVYTLGKAGLQQHLLSDSTPIELVQTDRGGQITYHGPGQLIAYLLLDIKRKNITIRQLVTLLENSVIETLNQHNIESYAKQDAPGVYVDEAKICSLGLRISKGCTLHGLALNVDMDLAPFKDINPCGYAGLKMTQIKDIVPTVLLDEVEYQLTKSLIQHLHYQTYQILPWNAKDYD